MIKDNGGSRSGLERRQIEVTGFIPERRSGKERRTGTDRRMGLGQRREHQNPDDLLPIERRDQFRRVNSDVSTKKVTDSELEASD